MAWIYLSASQVIKPDQGLLQSVIISPEDTPGASAHVTLYNATAATAGTEIMHLHASSSGESLSWSLENGIQFDALYATINSAHATIIWD